MTDAQATYLERLCYQTGEDFDPGLAKAEAAKVIDELRERTGR